jgi:hypothetical protein
MAKRDRTHKGAERYVALHHYLLGSPAWLGLTVAARAVYVEVAKLYNGSNNGRLALSVRDATARCNIARDTASRAFRELVDAGFLEETRHGGLSRKTRIASEWRMTAYYCDLTGSMACKTFLQRGRQPVLKDGRECPNTGPVLSQNAASDGLDCPNIGPVKPAFGPSPVLKDGTHIIYQGTGSACTRQAGAIPPRGDAGEPDSVVVPLQQSLDRRRLH